MKIPGENVNEGYDRLMFYHDAIQVCFYSRKKRQAQYDVLRHYYLYGTGPETDPTPYNKVEPIIDTLSAFLYSADSTRFSTHFPPETPSAEWDKAQPIAKAVNSEWTDRRAHV